MSERRLQANEKLDFQTVMASTVHDLKNSVGMLIDTLRDTTSELTPQEQTLRTRFSRLESEAMRVSNDLIQLLTVYKIDHGICSLDISHHSVRDLLEECMLQYSPLIEHKGINMYLECPEELYWFLDHTLVCGVINNVLNNAIRYTKDALLLRGIETDTGLVIQVEDNGPGYPDQLLTPTDNNDSGVDFSSGSTGLGLYFSALVAHQHHNKGTRGHAAIDNDSSIGGGRFSLFLP